MATKRPTRRPPTLTKDEREFQLRLHRTNLFATGFTTVVRGLVLVAIFWLGNDAIWALAGETTTADIGLKVLGDVKISTAAAWLFGLGATGYGLAQRRFRHKANEELGTRVSELEQGIDPGRTSSKLTKRGQTARRDSL